MKATNLTVCVPYKGCDKKCPYCISEITPRVESSEDMFRSANKVRNFAHMARVNSVLITSKGEPMLNPTHIELALYEFAEWPLELQTNGLKLSKDPDQLGFLSRSKLNTLAISIDSKKYLFDDDTFGVLVEAANKWDLVTRLTINASKDMDITAELLLERCKELGVNQVTLRKLSYPNGAPSSNPQVRWIEENTKGCYESFVRGFTAMDLKEIRRLPNLAVSADELSKSSVYDCQGISLVMSDYCIQEFSNPDDIRSLIFHEDGHLYTSWDSPASILF